ncbi:hypothetical protein DM02DRAFT_702354 [Periconia macrospinosa]|uniref:Aminoglycoside phosphotransferase domain-containing protein n=1 Tax=Periconia macrospinosa TaxID=97972 RepID=A0A2V1DVH0_9PLEO|nr:hypothetical protein DM02DRAFT_702354 [Periconia macrospinosa]
MSSQPELPTPTLGSPSTPAQLAYIPPQEPDAKLTSTNKESGLISEADSQAENDSVADDVVSLTDTELYDGDDIYEPFEKYQHKVSELAAQVFPNTHQIIVERLGSGVDNRALGITVLARPANKYVGFFQRLLERSRIDNRRKQYALRVPRGNPEFVVQQVAVLRILAVKVPLLPIAEVVTWDSSENNVLGSPFMVQTRIQGQPLKKILHKLNSRQLQSVLKQLMNIRETLVRFQSPCAGEISEENILAPQSDIQVSKYYVPGRNVEMYKDWKPRTWPAFPQDALTVLIEQCERWREHHQLVHDYAYDYLWDSFITMSKTLDKLGFLDGPFSLEHGDLGDQNILATIKEDTVEITGVIDWDYARFVPRFVAYRAPFLMWVDEKMDWVGEDIVPATHEPESVKLQLLKQYFETHASEEWKRFAFAPEAILGRQMFHVLMRGLYASWEVDQAEAILKEWDELHPEDNITPTDPLLDSDSEPESDDKNE